MIRKKLIINCFMFQTHRFWGDYGIALTSGIFLHLAFEMPIPYIEGFLFNRNQKSKNEKSVNQ